MPLSWNEIKKRAIDFQHEWQDESSEHAEAKSFWDSFFNVFGISRRRVATFEHNVNKLCNKQGFIDLFWKGTLIVEHKSRGRNLDKAYEQAIDYFPGLTEDELPQYVLVSDFSRFRLYDLDNGTTHEFALSDFHENIHLFGFIAGYVKKEYKDEDPVNIKAALLMGELHDKMKANGYTGPELERFLVRILFCLFADDAGIFEKGIFTEFVEDKTREDAYDLGSQLAMLFQVLNTPLEKRQKNLDEGLQRFPYVNGDLFQDFLPLASFDSAMRQALLRACYFDWSQISPAIFGSLFQSVMNTEERRNLGAHYTSEKNILKLIKPLFLDDLWREFDKIKSSRPRLVEFHHKIAGLKFMDPACGCGNFLIIAYRELRLLEIAILKALSSSGQLSLNIALEVKVDVDAMIGIEIEEFPARIAEVAMWLIDHQMNMRVSEEFGQYYVRLPLRKAARIIHDNALRLDWETIVPKTELNYILGNPPFVGAKYMDATQRQDMKDLLSHVKNYGLLDYVTAWYFKAADYIKNTDIRVAFVSTNSISQGEQVGVLWSELLRQHLRIHFAHRTFKWKSEARGMAAVHCVIIGFGFYDRADKMIFDYGDIAGEPHEIRAQNINPYLVDAPDTVILRRRQPLCHVPEIGIGNKPIDGGNYLFTTEEKDQFIKKEPQAAKWMKRWLGAHEFINGYERWCLWLGDCPPDELRKMPEAMKRVEAVRQVRLASKSAPTRKIAATPTRFHVENMPEGTFLLVPKVSSERRNYIPIGFMHPDTLVSDLVFLIPNATRYHFGILSSLQHMTWVRYTCGRLESRYRYSKDIVYNNYPWPDNPTPEQKQQVAQCAQAVLDTRANYPTSSLADLYDPLSMPPDLVKAHQALDKAVDRCYRPQPFTSDRNRIEYLFELYSKYTAPLAYEKRKKK